MQFIVEGGGEAQNNNSNAWNSNTAHRNGLPSAVEGAE